LTLQRSTNLENLLGIGHSFIAYRANRPQGVGGIFPYPAKWQPMGAGKRFYLPKFFRLLFSFARLPIVAKLAVPIGTWGFRTMPILETRWESAGRPAEGWVWAALTRSGHVESSSLKKQHSRAFKTLAEEARKNNQKPVRPFVLYSTRCVIRS